MLGVGGVHEVAEDEVVAERYAEFGVAEQQPGLADGLTREDEMVSASMGVKYP